MEQNIRYTQTLYEISGGIKVDREKCRGCHHDTQEDGGWCYMFEKKPEGLPCTQYDMNVKLREMVGNMIIKTDSLSLALLMQLVGTVQQPLRDSDDKLPSP